MLLLAGAVGTFVVITIWWLTQDDRVQDWDSGLHTVDAFVIHDEIAAGHLTAPFTEFNMYPPLGHLVGALASFVGGMSPDTVIVASNVVFVPLLAAGCFGVGRLVYGSSRAGLFAALFALGTPMIVSEFHEFLLDPQQTALVAVGLWAILASNRFERTWVSALAGALAGAAMLTKQTSFLFLLGPIIVVVLRGGWRNWKGWLAFGAALAIIAGPWYVYHLHQLNELVAVHDGSGSGASEAGGIYPPRLSKKSFGWYFWDTVNIQVLVPLSMAALIGVCLAVRDCWRDRSAGNLKPEMLVGLFVSWLGVTLITHKDPRYSLPALVYLAVLGTGWIATCARPVARRFLTGAFLAVVAINLIGVSAGLGGVVRISLPGAPTNSALAERHLTFYSPDGWLRGGPEHDGDVLALLRGLKRVGVHTVTFDAGSSDDINFNTSGLEALAIDAGIQPTFVYNPAGLGPHDAFLLRHVPVAGDPPPCQMLNDGTGIYVVLGNPVVPFDTYTFICPGRKPLFYKRTAPLPLETQLQMNPEITGAPRGMLLGVLAGLHSHGIQFIQFDRTSADKQFFQPTGIERLAVISGLPVPAGVTPSQIPADAAFLTRKPPASGAPAPCGRFPDGSGLYVILGDPEVAHPDYYCPVHRP